MASRSVGQARRSLKAARVGRARSGSSPARCGLPTGGGTMTNTGGHSGAACRRHNDGARGTERERADKRERERERARARARVMKPALLSGSGTAFTPLAVLSPVRLVAAGVAELISRDSRLAASVEEVHRAIEVVAGGGGVISPSLSALLRRQRERGDGLEAASAPASPGMVLSSPWAALSASKRDPRCLRPCPGLGTVLVEADYNGW